MHSVPVRAIGVTGENDRGFERTGAPNERIVLRGAAGAVDDRDVRHDVSCWSALAGKGESNGGVDEN